MKHTRPLERSEGSGGNTALLKGGEAASKVWRKGEEREGEGHWRGRITKKASDTRPPPSYSGSLGGLAFSFRFFFSRLVHNFRV